MFQVDRQETMRSSRKNRSKGENLSHRRNVDKAKAARAKAAIKAAKSQSPKSAYKKRKLKAAVDLETPKSLLVNIRLKSIINLDTYNLLSRKEKERLVQLLPPCDQPKDHSGMPILNSEALNNEFFAKACVEWCERLAEGEFVKDRQQGDASWKVSHMGTLNGAKSHVIGNLSTNAKLDRSERHSALTNCSFLPLNRLGSGFGSRISVGQLADSNSEPLPKGYHRHPRNSRLKPLTVDDGASLKSECFSKTSENHTSDIFVNPALRDHDYVWPIPQYFAAESSMAKWKPKVSRSSTVTSRYRRKRNRKRVRSKERVSVGIHKGKVYETQGHDCLLPSDLLAGKSGMSLETDVVASVANVNGVLRLNGTEGNCSDSNSRVLSVENTLINNPMGKSNDRLNETCSPNKREQDDYVAIQHKHLVSVAAHNSRLKENDVNLNYITRPCRLKTSLHLRKCEQTDGMPLIQIQSSDLLSWLTSAKSETDPFVNEPCVRECPSVCLSKSNVKLNACDENFDFPELESQSARTAPDVNSLPTGLSNSASLHELSPIRSNELQASDFSLKSDDTKFFVKVIGIQKIPFSHETTDGEASSQDLIKVDKADSPLVVSGSNLPPSVLQKVRQYVSVGGNFPHVGQYSPSGRSNGQLVAERSVEKPLHLNGIRSQADCVMHKLLGQTDAQGKHLSSQYMHDFKLNTDLRNRHASYNVTDSSDCVWEAVMQQKDAVHHVH